MSSLKDKDLKIFVEPHFRQSLSNMFCTFTLYPAFFNVNPVSSFLRCCCARLEAMISALYLQGARPASLANGQIFLRMVSRHLVQHDVVHDEVEWLPTTFAL